MHFFAISSNLMRRVLVELTRAHGSRKRGGDMRRVESDKAFIPFAALDDALSEFEKVDSRQPRAVELRFFGGLTVEETADVLGISLQTVKRDWEKAKVWLLRYPKHQNHADSPKAT